MTSLVKLSSSDGQEFAVPKGVACLSVLIENMLEDIGDNEDQPIPLPNVSGGILQKVVEYATHHKDDPPPSAEDENKPKSSDDIDEWDREFMNVDQGTLFELILAANYLDMKGLLDLGAFSAVGVECFRSLSLGAPDGAVDGLMGLLGWNSVLLLLSDDGAVFRVAHCLLSRSLGLPGLEPRRADLPFPNPATF